jgi:hypothetical protein
MNPQELRDPFVLAKTLWPHVYFYDKQREAIRSVIDFDETVLVAGNMLGKDFVAGFIVLWFFLTRTPCRIVTTSAKADHLRVLWGEINQYISTSTQPLRSEDGGPLVCNHLEMKKLIGGKLCPKSYVVGLVAADKSIASMQGHHIADVGDGVPRTLFVCDESSSVADEYKKMAHTWAQRELIFGNPWPCENFFRRAVRDGSNKYRKVIKIRATDSPNVRYGLAEKALGREPSNKTLVAGVKGYRRYCADLELLSDIEKSVSLDAEFYEGRDIKMFPREYLDKAKQIADSLTGRKRQAKAIGIDPGEGGANTAWAAVDELGLIELRSYRTPDTSQIVGDTIAFGKQHGVAPSDWIFDRGGGGFQHANVLRNMGYPVRTVAFGESVSLEIKRGLYPTETRREAKEERYVYVNRRAEMYGELRIDIEDGFGLPAIYDVDKGVFQQLRPIPLTFDGEGRLRLLPKHKTDPNSKEPTLTDLIGFSPDEADALVLANHGRRHVGRQTTAGAVGYGSYR